LFVHRVISTGDPRFQRRSGSDMSEEMYRLDDQVGEEDDSDIDLEEDDDLDDDDLEDDEDESDEGEDKTLG